MAGNPPNAGGSAGRPEPPFDPAPNSSSWYLKPWVLAIWGVLVLVLIAVIVYGLFELAQSGGGKPAPTTPSTMTTSPTTSTSTTEPRRTATTSSAVPSSSAETTPTAAPPVTTFAPSTAVPTRQHPHRHWWTDLPTTRLPSFPP